MKKYIFIISIILFGWSNNLKAQGGSCAAASAAPVTLPYSATGQTTCGMGNTYTGMNTVVCGNGLYLDGEDILYVFTPTATGLVTINVTSSSSWVGLFLYQGCPTGGTCVANAASTSEISR
ncbi:MAG TPA: hypothetical protein PK833_00100 [Vicingus sp.]|nr:hypothetical protein [Vicingus sp.]